MTLFTRFKLFLWYFGHFNVRLIGYLKPKLLTLTDQQLIVKLPLKKRSKNHLHSMYFGALAVGADIAGGLHGFYHADKAKLKVSLAFKSFQAQFLKRPESDVYFISESGEAVAEMLDQSRLTGDRVNKTLPVKAYTNYYNEPELVAEFNLELSLKVLK